MAVVQIAECADTTITFYQAWGSNPAATELASSYQVIYMTIIKIICDKYFRKEAFLYKSRVAKIQYSTVLPKFW